MRLSRQCLKLVKDCIDDATRRNELIDSIAAQVCMIDDADSWDVKDVNDAKRVTMKYWLFMRKVIGKHLEIKTYLYVPSTFVVPSSIETLARRMSVKPRMRT